MKGIGFFYEYNIACHKLTGAMKGGVIYYINFYQLIDKRLKSHEEYVVFLKNRRAMSRQTSCCPCRLSKDLIMIIEFFHYGWRNII